MGNVKQKGKYYMTKKTIIRKFIKNIILYIIFELVLNVALVCLDNTNIDPEGPNKHLYLPIALGIPILACSISNEIIDRIEKHLDKIKREK